MKDCIIVEDKIGVKWENDYIEMLRDQNMHVYATEVIHTSPHNYI